MTLQLLSKLQTARSRKGLGFVTAVVVLAGLLILWKGAQLQAQTQCQNPPLNPNHGGWAQGSSGVTYRISSNATTAQTSQIDQAFQSWSSANQSNNSNVTFQNMGSAVGPSQVSVTLCNTAGCAPGGFAAFTQTTPAIGSPITGATITIDTTQVSTANSNVLRVALHEIGHTMGLGELGQSGEPNCGMVPGGSVMNRICDGSFGLIPTSVTGCDNNGINELPDYPPPPPPPPPSGCPRPDDCAVEAWDSSTCSCDWEIQVKVTGGSPIIVALGKDSSYRLTSKEAGVWFDLNADGKADLTAWTPAGEPLGFLALDRNSNGIVDHGGELFGNFTSLSCGQQPNHGFEALAEFDKAELGGNGDGVIDARDAVWQHLRLWVDSNHNGFSEPVEIYSPGDFALSAIHLDIRVENRRDKYGNVYRFKAPVEINNRVRFAYDVFFRVRLSE